MLVSLTNYFFHCTGSSEKFHEKANTGEYYKLSLKRVILQTEIRHEYDSERENKEKMFLNNV